MSISSPTGDWFKAPTGAERTWVGLSLIWCVVMFVMMPYWMYRGRQNSAGEAYSVRPVDFVTRVDRFTRANQVGMHHGTPVVAPAPGSDVYLLAQMWRWTPVLRLREGQTYRLHISSSDLQHGFSLLPLNMNFHVVPGYDHVLTITPTRRGEFTIICNEFCGIGHHMMTGRIIVE